MVFYTDGLVERRGEDICDGLGRLATTLSDVVDPAIEMDQVLDLLVAKMLGDGSGGDDVCALLLHRGTPSGDTGRRQVHLKPRPLSVGTARTLARQKR